MICADEEPLFAYAGYIFLNSSWKYLFLKLDWLRFIKTQAVPNSLYNIMLYFKMSNFHAFIPSCCGVARYHISVLFKVTISYIRLASQTATSRQYLTSFYLFFAKQTQNGCPVWFLVLTCSHDVKDWTSYISVSPDSLLGMHVLKTMSQQSQLCSLSVKRNQI